MSADGVFVSSCCHAVVKEDIFPCSQADENNCYVAFKLRTDLPNWAEIHQSIDLPEHVA